MILVLKYGICIVINNLFIRFFNNVFKERVLFYTAFLHSLCVLFRKKKYLTGLIKRVIYLTNCYNIMAQNISN